MKRFRELIDIARAEGVEGARVLYGGKHARLVGTFQGRAIRLVVSISPRVPRVQGVKVRAHLRRPMRESGKMRP